MKDRSQQQDKPEQAQDTAVQTPAPTPVATRWAETRPPAATKGRSPRPSPRTAPRRLSLRSSADAATAKKGTGRCGDCAHAQRDPVIMLTHSGIFVVQDTVHTRTQTRVADHIIILGTPLGTAPLLLLYTLLSLHCPGELRRRSCCFERLRYHPPE